MTGADQHASSTVADEAVRLASALAALTTPVPGEGADGTGPARARTTEEDAPAPGAGEPGSEESGPGAAGDAGPACACASPSVQSVCEICPICRVAAFLSEIRPETVERVADLLSLVAGSLETFAAQRRAEMAGSQQPEPATESSDAGDHEGWRPVDVESEEEDT